MLRKLLGAGMLLATLAGCTELRKPCAADMDCGEGGACDTGVGLCYSLDTEPPVDPSFCTPLCPDYQVCTGKGCVARFDRLTIQAPANNALIDAGPVQVVARLEVKEAYRAGTRFPTELDFSAERTVGGVAGALGNYTHDDAGTYSATWLPPAEETNVTVSAEYPDPDAGLRGFAIVRVDAVPPVFNVTVPPAVTGASDGGTTYVDPDAGSLTNLWRRDQQVTVRIQTNEPNLDPESLKVVLKGTDGVARPPVSVTPVTQGCVDLFCGEALLNLWEPTFDAFRGSMALEIQGNDLAGNVGTTSPASPQVNVTRWKWALSGLAGTIKTSPAIGEKGTVYVGTSDGKVVALTPEGTKAWEATPGGSVASLSVGASDGGVESIYVAANAVNSNAVLYALSSAGGGVRVRCPSTNELDGPVQSAMAVTTIGNPPTRFESGVAIVNNGASSQLWALRPEASASGQCVLSNSIAGISETSQDSSLVASGSTFFYATSTTNAIARYIFGLNALDGVAITSDSQTVNGLTFTGGKLVGGGGSGPAQGGLYSVPESGMNTTAMLLPGTSGGRVWNPIIGPGGAVVLYGQDTSNIQGNLKKYDLPSQTVAGPTVSNVGVLKYAPALGVDGVLYTAPSSSSVVSAWSADDFSARWSVLLGAAPASASVGLDCARGATGAVVPGRPGTLYVPSGGVLHAIIVDSPGLNRDAAAWPKYQHDARNTGNPATTGPNCQ